MDCATSLTGGEKVNSQSIIDVLTFFQIDWAIVNRECRVLDKAPGFLGREVGIGRRPCEIDCCDPPQCRGIESLVAYLQERYAAPCYVRPMDENTFLVAMNAVGEKTRIERDYLNAIFEASYDGLYVTDKNGITVRVNQAYERITGVRREEVMGRLVDDLVREGTLSDSVTATVRKTKRPRTIEQTIRTGKRVVITGSPIFDEKGEVSYVVTNVRDITELNALCEQLKEANAKIEALRGEDGSTSDIVAASKAMQEVLQRARTVSKYDCSVLLLGESGVGKSLLAREIHRQSCRPGAFIEINCATIPTSLAESELFGYEKGAFTGAAKQGKKGKLEAANFGTLFLDEIADLSLDVQAKLLNALQEKVIYRLGGITPIPVDIRVIAATNKCLKELVRQGKFREDLFWRLNVVPLEIPPLRARREDIIPLVSAFLARLNHKYGLHKRIDPEVLRRLMEYDWPGNVRELGNVIERAYVMATGRVITVTDLPPELNNTGNTQAGAAKELTTLKEAMQKLEAEMIKQAFTYYKSSVGVAKALGISQPTAWRKIRRYGLFKVE
jgi:PAS domain S-box-containing protein